MQREIIITDRLAVPAHAQRDQRPRIERHGVARIELQRRIAVCKRGVELFADYRARPAAVDQRRDMVGLEPKCGVIVGDRPTEIALVVIRAGAAVIGIDEIGLERVRPQRQQITVQADAGRIAGEEMQIRAFAVENLCQVFVDTCQGGSRA